PGRRPPPRRYRDTTLVVETDFEHDAGAVTVVDCMPPREGPPVDVRQVIGRRGTVPMRMDLVIRTDYGSVVPWVRRTKRGIRGVGAPDAISLNTNLPLRGEGLTTVSEFSVRAGERRSMTLSWHPSNVPASDIIDADAAVRDTEAWLRVCARRRRGGGARPRGMGAAVDRAVHLRRPQPRRGAALPGHHQGADLRADRRPRCRADHLPARADRWRAQLGLPHLLGARRHLRALRPGGGRLPRRGARLAAVADARGRRAGRGGA